MAIAQPTCVSFESGQDGTWTVSLSPAEDVTGWTVSCTVRAYNGGTALITLTTSSGITVSDTGNGVFVCTFTAAQLALTYGPGAYVIQLHRTNAGFTYPITDASPLILRAGDGTASPTITNLGEYSTHALMGITLTDAMSKQLIQLLAVAESRVKRYCGNDFVYRATQTEYYDGSGTPDLRLNRTPVWSIDAIYLDWNGNAGTTTGSFDATSTILTAGDDYYLPLDQKFGESASYSGLVKKILGAWPTRKRRPIDHLGYIRETLSGCLKVTYTAGYRLMPHALKWAVWQLTSIMEASSVSGRIANSESGEGFSQSFGGNDHPSGIPNHVRAVLDSYRDGRMMVR